MTCFSRLWTTLLLFSVTAFGALQAQAAIACPVILVNGHANQDGVDLTFINRGKLPLDDLELSCTSFTAQTTRRSACHAETGIFYPGTTYTVQFSLPQKDTRSILVSLKSARLSDGDTWTSSHDQSCRSLKIAVKRKP
jgi:hypothetical protein